MSVFYNKSSRSFNQILGGSSQDDNYIFNLNDFGTYTITASSRSNSLDLSALTSNLSVNLVSSAGHEVSDGNGNYINWLNNTIYKINTGSGNDKVMGNNTHNDINTGSGNDSIFAGLGNDTLTGGTGNDVLDGGDGNDIYIFASGFGIDNIIDSAGIDTLNFANLDTPIIINLVSNSIINGINNINLTNSIIENIIGGLGHDIIQGNSVNNSLLGGLGNDSLNGDLGNDQLNGGAGHDTYIFGNNWGKDLIIDSEGNDTVDLSAVIVDLNIKLTYSSSSIQISNGNNSIGWSNDSIENVISGSGNDYIIGSLDNNIIKGGAGNDSILAGVGHDSIWGGAGNDILKGETGSDIYYFENNFGQDIIEDSNIASDINTVDLSNINKNLIINLTASDSNHEVRDEINTINWTHNSIQNIKAGSANDIISGSLTNNILDGQAGNDTYVNFVGNFGHDTIIDGSGYDILNLSQYTKDTEALFNKLDNDLAININKSSILIKDYYNGSIEEIIFANTTIYSNRPPNDINFISGGNINENNNNNGVFIGNLNTTDLDQNQSFSYSLLDNANGRFSVSVNGELSSNAGFVFDYETNTNYNITVRSTDQGGLYFDKVLNIAVNDIVELPSFADNLAINLHETGRYILNSTDLEVNNTNSNNWTYTVSDLNNNLNIQKWNGNSWTNLDYSQNTILNINGSLNSKDNTFSNGSLYDSYQMTIKAGESVKIDQISNFDDYLILTDINNNTLAINNDGGIGDNSFIHYTNNTNSDLQTIIYATTTNNTQQGNYNLIATTFTPQNTLTFTNSDIENGLISIHDNRGVETLMNIDATLSAGDLAKSNVYYDNYQIIIKAGATVKIAQNSNAFDSYLKLMNTSNNILLSENDDSRSFYNSVIEYTNTTNSDIEATIYATSYSANETGLYNLEVTSTFTQNMPLSAGFDISVTNGSLTSNTARFEVNIDSQNKVLDGDFLAHNINTQYDQTEANILTLNNGNFVVTRVDNNLDNYNIIGKLFNADGIAMGNDFAINSITSSWQWNADFRALNNGGFVAVWEDYSSGLGTSDIRTRVFTANGLAINASDILVSTSNASLNQLNPEVAVLNNNNFAITWQDYNSAGNYDIRARVYNSSGTALNNSDFLVSKTNGNNQLNPEITNLSNGNFVITWEDYSSGNSNANIRARIYNSSGTALNNSDFLVSSTNGNNQLNPEITNLNNGNFVITWEDYSSGTSNANIRARVYNSSGTAINNSDFLVSTTNANNQLNPEITNLSNGNFVITWEDNSQLVSDIRGRVFSSNGTALNTNDFLISTTNTNAQNNAEITTLSNGGFVIAWEDLSSGGHDIRGRVFNANGTAATNNEYDFLLSSTESDGLPYHQITALQDGGFAIAWETNDTANNYDIRMATFNALGYAVLSGTNGDDIFNSNYYNDINTYYDSKPQILAGGAGNDSYIMEGNIGNDTIKDASGNDYLDLTDYAFNTSVDPFSRIEGGIAGDDLLISLGAQGSITIQNYFNEAGTNAGTGYIEDLDFANYQDINISSLLSNAWV